MGQNLSMRRNTRGDERPGDIAGAEEVSGSWGEVVFFSDFRPRPNGLGIGTGATYASCKVSMASSTSRA